MNEINERDIAVFEAGIKLGALYHQFIGTPINTDTIDDLSRSIEESILLQPFVRSISVLIDQEMVEKRQNPKFKYCELEGRMLHVSLQILYKNTIAQAELGYDEEQDYPLMRIQKIEEM
ncbi:MAG: dihydroneopterin aldolase family protein [Candidatus Methanoperedens sp.]|nr:dihydroneopterin aldolase family protein [Candidatus Methanoperedens sp.]MCE8424976.1 dihydroneopterin aldolase family protein [Candidatus Methanoperedens sp.]MCE8427410.1 dihydroneopterin aldolase family protein [Candidatus Methanoperedens sp.]